MKYIISLFASVILLCISSCKVIGTLYPLSDNEKDFLFKKELIGKWGETKDSSGFCSIDTVAGMGGKLYQVVLTDQDKDNIVQTKWFLFRLVKLKEWYFMDCQLDLEKTIPNKGEEYSDLLVSKHFIFTVSFVGLDKLEIISPDPDELIKLIDQKKIMLNYSMLKRDDYLILNKSKELQKGFAESKKYSKLYKDKDILTRLK